MKSNLMLTCPNNACRKVFSKPLKTLNRQQTSKEPFYACPYCLTEITLTEVESDNAPEETTAEIAIPAEKPSQNQEQLSYCKHYFGYMSEKEHKKQMPEECMLCLKIIDCMVSDNGSGKGKT